MQTTSALQESARANGLNDTSGAVVDRSTKKACTVGHKLTMLPHNALVVCLQSDPGLPFDETL